MITLSSYTMVAIILFSIGTIGVINRKNIFVIYMSIELMLNAINLIFVAAGKHYDMLDTQIISMLIIAIAAAEAAVFLSLIVVLYKQFGILDVDKFNLLSHKKGDEA